MLKNFTYTFSTGNMIDSLRLSGKVLLAESGLADSTITVMLYRNLSDSAVLKTKPDYIAKINGSGNFKFNHLPGNDFKIYALKDGDGGKTYNSKTEIFAFTDSVINPLNNNAEIMLFAYAEQKADNNKISAVLKAPFEKRLKYTTSASLQPQDLLIPLELTFNNPLKVFDSSRALLSDTNYRPIKNVRVNIDSTRKKITVNANWQPESAYYFLLPKDAIEDSAGNFLTASDTLRFNTKRTADYGSVLLRFTNIELAKRPIIQFLQGEAIISAYPLLTSEWSNKQFPPGDYSIRILYDENNNGKWDPGNYTNKIQPEKATTLEQKLGVRADWENERDIKL